MPYIFFIVLLLGRFTFLFAKYSKNTALIQDLQYHGMNVNNVIAGIIIDL